VTPLLRKWLFETLYKNRYLYRFASTVPFAGQWRTWQRQVLGHIRGNDVLELGCGLGDLQADMLELGYACYAVERSPQMVAAARATLKRRGQRNGVLQGSAQQLPFSDGSFDSVVSTFPSEYIYDPDTIAEVERVLRPGGRLIVIEGANLLPVGFLQPCLILMQVLIYGSAAVFGPRKQASLKDEMATERGERRPEGDTARSNHDTGTGITTEEVAATWFGRHIPLEGYALKRRSLRIRSRRWEVYMIIGEKLAQRR
jgi:ubiquinone/menaquinone biosynthesis C-methylase UbiE